MAQNRRISVKTMDYFLKEQQRNMFCKEGAGRLLAMTKPQLDRRESYTLRLTGMLEVR